MVEIICERSGLIFQAENRRSKQHPAISKILRAAYEADDGSYAITCRAIQEGRIAGLETVEAFAEAVEIALGRKSQEQAEREAEISLDRQIRDASYREAQAERKERNALLRQQGFRWQKFDADRDSYAGDPDRADDGAWILYAPDGAEISLDSALRVCQGELTLAALRAEIITRADAAKAAAAAEVAGLTYFCDYDPNIVGALLNAKVAFSRRLVWRENKSARRRYEVEEIWISPADHAAASAARERAYSDS